MTATRTDWFVVFRVLFGCLITISSTRFFYHGWIEEMYVSPTFHFTFPGFGWISVAPPAVMYLLFSLMAVTGVLIAFNRWYRAACIIFFLVFTYIELIDVTYYLNHYYLVSLLAFMMIFYDSHSPSSTNHNQRILFFLRLQVSIVYFFGGINKIESDWLLRAQPLQIWLHANSQLPLIGRALTSELTAHAVALAAVVFDVGVSILLWFRSTRLIAYFSLVIFHLLTALLFHIGLFPWIMMSAALLFFAELPSGRAIFSAGSIRWSTLPLIIVAVWQLIFPLRHLMYPGNYLWTEQGFRFAWNIMLIEKNGSIDFGVRDQYGKMEGVDIHRYLTPFQIKMVSTQPDLIHQFAAHLKQQRPDITAVYAECYVSLNGRRSQLFFDPALNLLTTSDALYQDICLHTPAR